MLRFFTLSIFLHLAVYTLVVWTSEPVVYDAILSVEFFEPVAKNSAAPMPSPNKTVSKNYVQPNTTSALENTTPPNETVNSSQSAGSPLESANVTTNPRVLKQVKATYPQEAKQAGVQGAVKLSVIIDSTGQVQEVNVLEGPGYGLNETAQEALKQFIFSPAELHGEKVSVRIVYIYRFRLDTR